MEVVDILHKLTFETNEDVLQEVNKEFGTQIKQVNELKQREAEYAALLEKTAQSDVRNRKAVELLMQRNKQQQDALNVSIGRQFAANEKLNTSLQKTSKNLSSLSFAGSQVLREAPAFTYSIQTGILALSNNIPILIDQLNAAKATGASTTEIFKALGQSVFGLTGLITIAVSVLTIFAGKLFNSGEAAKDSAASIDTASKAIDSYAKILQDAANFNDEGANAIKRNIEALKAQGVQAGETFAAEKRIFEGEQALRAQEKTDLKDRIKAYEQVRAALTTGRGSAAQASRRFEQSVSGFPAQERDALIKSFNDGVLTRRSLNEKINQLNEDLKDKSNQITQAEVAFNSQQREKEYQLSVQLLRRLDEEQSKFAKLRAERGQETFDKIQQLNALELKDNEAKLDQEIEDARKAGTLSLQIQQQFEAIRLQIRKQANEKLLQENLEYFQQELEELEKVVSGLGSIFGDKADKAPTNINADLNGANDDIKRRLKKQKELKEKREDAKNDAIEATNIAIQSLQTIYEAQLYYADKEIALRQQRVDQATALAEKGNVEVLAEERKRLNEIQAERERIAQRQLQLNGIIAASNQAVALTEAIGAVVKAASEGDPYTIAFRVAAAVASLVAGIATISSAFSSANQGYKDGVIGLDGPGNETSDSIPARLSKGESVMTAAETRKYRPYLEAMRAGTFNAHTSDAVMVGQKQDYGKLEKKLDGVIDAINMSETKVNAHVGEKGFYVMTERNRLKEARRWR
jgi:hypothetical protein